MERHKLTYDISQLRDYINWSYFYHAWQLKTPAQQMEIKEEAMRMLDTLEGNYRAYALFALGEANSDGDVCQCSDNNICQMLQSQICVWQIFCDQCLMA